jgi:hypothetical protein
MSNKPQTTHSKPFITTSSENQAMAARDSGLSSQAIQLLPAIIGIYTRA